MICTVLSLSCSVMFPYSKSYWRKLGSCWSRSKATRWQRGRAPWAREYHRWNSPAYLCKSFRYTYITPRPNVQVPKYCTSIVQSVYGSGHRWAVFLLHVFEICISVCIPLSWTTIQCVLYFWDLYFLFCKIQNTFLYHFFFFIMVHNLLAPFHPVLVSEVCWHYGVIKVSGKWPICKCQKWTLAGNYSNALLPMKQGQKEYPVCFAIVSFYINIYILLI